MHQCNNWASNLNSSYLTHMCVSWISCISLNTKLQGAAVLILTGFFQVPNSAMSLREAAPAPPGAPLRRPIHHRGGVLQKDHRQCTNHQAPLWHVQVQWYMNSHHWSMEKTWAEGPERPTQQSSECQIIAGGTMGWIFCWAQNLLGCLKIAYLGLGSIETKTAIQPEFTK